ncbi:MAG: hypothetical protein P8Z30_16905, partial [Acidobacteriota bacterium]
MGEHSRLLTGWVGSRRKFLGYTAALSFLPAPLRQSALSHPGQVPRFAAPRFAIQRLHPHYRVPGPLANILKKIDPEHDRYPAEKFAARIQTVLRKWDEALLHSVPSGIEAIGRGLAGSFRGSSLRPIESHVLRADTHLEIRRRRFSSSPALDRNAFVESFGALLAPYSALR